MTEKTQTKVKIELFDKQFEAYNSTKQFVATIAGVQSGKTHVGSIWAMKKINQYPDKDGMIVAPSYKILQQSTLRKFFTLFPQFRAFYKEQRSCIDLPTGGTVFVRSMDKPLGAEGTTAHWIWADELGQSPVLAWTILRSRVAFTGGQIFITTTPYNMGWLYRDFYLPWKKKLDPSLQVFSWRSIDNPWFPVETYEAEKKRLSPEEFHRRYMGQFSKPHGLVYKDFDDTNIVPDREIDGYTIAGIDFGFTNPTAIVVLRYDSKEENWYLIDEWYKTHQTQDEINTVALSLQQKYNIRKWFPDSAEPDRIASMRNVGLTCYQVNKDIGAGTDKVRELIRKHQLFVFSSCHNTIDEFANYHYAEKKDANKDTPSIKEMPVKEYDHAMDALRYALFSDNPVGSSKSKEEAFFNKKMKEKEEKKKQKFLIRGY